MIVISQDRACRDRAVNFCDELMKRFWAQCEFDISWLSFGDLSRENEFRNAAVKAGSADVVLFSMDPAADAPLKLQSWAEAWLAKRSDHEGLVIGLGDPGHIPGGGVSKNFVYVRNLAHRAGMDYLTELPDQMGPAIPDSLDSYRERAQQHSSVLDQILDRKVPALFRD